jgi:hypothetical protein
MANSGNANSKRMQISKATATMVIVVSVGAFLSVFSLMASRTLLSQRGYQQRVITGKEKARDTLKSNVDAIAQVKESYRKFSTSETNVIGGSSNGANGRNGDNPKIVLDALPSKYDFPALATSLDILLSDARFSDTGVTGVDDEVAQKDNKDSANPVAVEMPFELGLTADYQGIKDFVHNLYVSIRPIQLKSIGLNADEDNDIRAVITAKTYYQPSKVFKIEEKPLQ